MRLGRRCVPRDEHCFIRLYGFLSGEMVSRRRWVQGKKLFWGKNGHMGETEEGMGLRKGHSPRKRLGWVEDGL